MKKVSCPFCHKEAIDNDLFISCNNCKKVTDSPKSLRKFHEFQRKGSDKYEKRT